MATPKEQLDLFVALVGDIPLRDDREMMSAPMVSLSKRPPTRLEWTGPSGQHVVITGSEDGGGIATIWDFDILIWAVSQLNAQLEMGQTPGPTVTFRPYDLLKAIGRSTSGKDYQAFKASIDRLRTTRVRTTIRRRHKDRYEDFSLLADFSLEEANGKPMGAQMTLPRWIHRAVVDSREVLAISPLYFELSRGLDRFLYRLARRHAGNQADGWAFSFWELHRRTGTPMRFSDFARQLRLAVERDALPEYTMKIESGAQGPLLRFVFRKEPRLL